MATKRLVDQVRPIPLTRISSACRGSAGASDARVTCPAGCHRGRVTGGRSLTRRGKFSPGAETVLSFHFFKVSDLSPPGARGSHTNKCLFSIRHTNLAPPINSYNQEPTYTSGQADGGRRVYRGAERPRNSAGLVAGHRWALGGSWFRPADTVVRELSF